ncbi:MAG: hypothetical protein KDG50_10960 [Chromatiales bacterium]|nr:hypothetical protein [Chromatiales bacterium]
MASLSPDQERAILESAPKGTWTLMLLVALGFTAAWLFMFLVRFLGHGPVN